MKNSPDEAEQLCAKAVPEQLCAKAVLKIAKKMTVSAEELMHIIALTHPASAEALIPVIETLCKFTSIFAVEEQVLAGKLAEQILAKLKG